MGSEGDPLLVGERWVRWGPGAPCCGTSGPGLAPSLEVRVTPQRLDPELLAGWLGGVWELEIAWMIEFVAPFVPGMVRSSIIRFESGDFSISLQDSSGEGNVLEFASGPWRTMCSLS